YVHVSRGGGGESGTYFHGYSPDGLVLLFFFFSYRKETRKEAKEKEKIKLGFALIRKPHPSVPD
ncbi:MAG: hypothetical protein IJB30_04845, partial [Clostridia bacterium]|nr:hypothetical protein [Clostridia bacterium]